MQHKTYNNTIIFIVTHNKVVIRLKHILIITFLNYERTKRS